MRLGAGARFARIERTEPAATHISDPTRASASRAWSSGKHKSSSWIQDSRAAPFGQIRSFRSRVADDCFRRRDVAELRIEPSRKQSSGGGFADDRNATH